MSEKVQKGKARDQDNQILKTKQTIVTKVKTSL